jgi:hypothetical protein
MFDDRCCLVFYLLCLFYLFFYDYYVYVILFTMVIYFLTLRML